MESCPQAYWDSLYLKFARSRSPAPPTARRAEEQRIQVAEPRLLILACPASYWNALHALFSARSVEPSAPSGDLQLSRGRLHLQCRSCPASYFSSLFDRFPRSSVVQVRESVKSVPTQVEENVKMHSAESVTSDTVTFVAISEVTPSSARSACCSSAEVSAVDVVTPAEVITVEGAEDWLPPTERGPHRTKAENSVHPSFPGLAHVHEPHTPFYSGSTWAGTMSSPSEVQDASAYENPLYMAEPGLVAPVGSSIGVARVEKESTTTLDLDADWVAKLATGITDGPPPAPPPSMPTTTLGSPTGKPTTSRRQRTTYRMRLGKKQIARLKPLLCDLHREFLQFSTGLGQLNLAQLSSTWKECARRKLGELRDEDVKLIDSSVKMIFDMPELDNSGLLSFDDLASLMLGGAEEATALKRVRLQLNSFMEESPSKMKLMLQRIFSWEAHADRGLMTEESLRSCLDDLQSIMGLQKMEATLIFKQIVDELDRDAHGRFAFSDVISHLFGRRKSPVELLLYDVSAGYASWLSRLLLGSRFEAIYHSGVLVFGREYWYGGKVFKSTPASETKNFGSPLTESVIRLAPSQYVPGLEIVSLGHTYATVKDWHLYVNRKLCRDYTVDTYDALSHNCNTFSDEGVNFLTGGGHLPEEVTQQVAELMNTPVASVLRPTLNRCFGDLEPTGGPGLQDTTNDARDAWACCGGKALEDCRGCPRRVMTLPCCGGLGMLQAEEKLEIEMVLPISSAVVAGGKQNVSVRGGRA